MSKQPRQQGAKSFGSLGLPPMRDLSKSSSGIFAQGLTKGLLSSTFIKAAASKVEADKLITELHNTPKKEKKRLTQIIGEEVREGLEEVIQKDDLSEVAKSSPAQENQLTVAHNASSEQNDKPLPQTPTKNDNNRVGMDTPARAMPTISAIKNRDEFKKLYEASDLNARKQVFWSIYGKLILDLNEEESAIYEDRFKHCLVDKDLIEYFKGLLTFRQEFIIDVKNAGNEKLFALLKNSAFIEGIEEVISNLDDILNAAKAEGKEEEIIKDAPEESLESGHDSLESALNSTIAGEKSSAPFGIEVFETTATKNVEELRKGQKEAIERAEKAEAELKDAHVIIKDLESEYTKENKRAEEAEARAKEAIERAEEAETKAKEANKRAEEAKKVKEAQEKNKSFPVKSIVGLVLSAGLFTASLTAFAFGYFLLPAALMIMSAACGSAALLALTGMTIGSVMIHKHRGEVKQSLLDNLEISAPRLVEPGKSSEHSK